MSQLRTDARQEAPAAEPADVRETPAPPLRHIAIIPDGNRRWAAARGLPLWDGVRQGAKTAEAIFEAIRARRIPWCTFWASSYDNLTERPKTERHVLNELFADWFLRLAKNETVHRDRVRIRALGEWRDLLTEPAARAIERVIEATGQYAGPALTFLIGYDGDRELAAAATALLRQLHSEPRTQNLELTVALDDLRAHSWTKELPPVDLLLRTGAWEDPHRSANFLPLLTSNVQEAYPKVFWPDFAEAELETVLADFAARERRLGR